MKAPILTLLLVALALAGCQSVPPQAKDEGKGGEDKVVTADRGIGQVRDMDTGDPYYAISEPRVKPTLKTRYRPPAPVMPVPEVVAPAQAIPVPVASVEVAPATPAPSVPAPVAQPAATKHLVPFAFGRSRLGPQGQEAMNAILQGAKTAERVHVRGHTDIIGRMPGNKRLAMARAAEIRTYLVKRGVSADKVSASYCIDCFADSNETAQGRAANRRAVVVLRPTAAAAEGSIDLDRRYLSQAGLTHVTAALPIDNKTEVKR